LVLAGAEQRRHFPPLGDGLGGVVPILQRIVVAARSATPVSAIVHASPHHGHRKISAIMPNGQKYFLCFVVSQHENIEYINLFR
jgi:hypothetical protein